MEGRTSFVIAHRLSTIREADLILVMDQGRSLKKAITRPCWQLAAFIANCTKVNFQKKPSKPKRASSLTGSFSQGWCYSEKESADPFMDWKEKLMDKEQSGNETHKTVSPASLQGTPCFVAKMRRS